MTAVHVVLVDSFDSFTFNLVEEFARRGSTVEVWRNDTPVDHLLHQVEAAAARGCAPLLVLSPGPGTPGDAGCLVPLVRAAASRVPIFGVCLGHQAIIEAFGGIVGPAGVVVHGKATKATHRGDPLFAGIPPRFTVGRYHSLVGLSLRAPIEPIAWADTVIMAARHATAPTVGVQFHPESVLTPDGGVVFENVLTLARAHHAGRAGGAR